MKYYSTILLVLAIIFTKNIASGENHDQESISNLLVINDSNNHNPDESTSSMTLDLGPDLTFCEGDSAILDATTPGSTYLWQDGSTSPTFTVTESGTYWVTVNTSGNIETDSIDVTVNNTSNFSFGPDLVICEGTIIVLSGFTPNATYLWQNGSTASFLSVNQAGTYSLEVNLNGCLHSDTITISYVPNIDVDLGPDQNICLGDQVNLNAFINDPTVTYTWQDGTTTSTYTITQTGTYHVTLDNGVCPVSDTIEVFVNSTSSVDLGPDTSICSGESILLDANTSGASYLWQDGSTGATLIANQSGWYWVNVTIGSCSDTDSIFITETPTPVIDLGLDQTICDGDSTELNAFYSGATYTWQDGSNNATLWASQPGTYIVTVDLNGCTFVDSTHIFTQNFSTFNFGPDTTLCQGETLVLSGLTPGATYLWQDGSTNSFLNITQTGQYSLTVDLNGCLTNDTIQVDFTPSPIISLGPDQFICQGDSTLLDAFYLGATYLWQDGSTGSSIYVSQTGLYYVDLDFNGCTYSDSIQITVGNVSNFSLGNDTTLCQGEILVLSGLTPGATYQWQDGSTNSFLNITQTGQYSLTVDLNGCITNDTIQVNFTPSPIISLGPDQFICQGDSTLLDAFYQGATYSWQDGSSSSTFWASQTGTYSVVLDLNGCTYEDQINIVVNNYPVINLGNDTSICETDLLILNAANPGSTYTWQDGSSNPTFTVMQSGSYYVSVNNNGCISSDTIEVIVKSSPVIDLGPDLSACDGDEIILNASFPGASYQWNTGSTNSIIYIQSEGLYTVNLLLNGCSYEESIYITYFPIPEINLEDSVEICDGEIFPIDASYPNSGTNYTWHDGTTNPIFNAQIQGWNIVTVEVNGCEFTDSLYLTVHNLPATNLVDTSICLGEEFLFNAFTFDALAYEWQDGSTNPTFIADEEGWYYVDIFNEHCQVRDSAFLQINTVPLFGLPADTFLCENEPIIFEFDENNASYVWQDGSTSNLYSVEELGIYTLTISNSCGTSDFTMRVHPRDCECVLYTPNAFSPGNGGINETFSTFTECNIFHYQMNIFSRWGKLLFSSSDPTKTWDGTFDGKELPQDVYIYNCNYTFVGESILHTDNGTLTLLR